MGSRNRLAQEFVADLADAWAEHGATALARCATEEPVQFCRIVASLMPRDIDVQVTHLDAGTFAARFRQALELLHDQPEPQPKTIEHTDADQRR